MKSIPALTLGLATKSPVILWGSPGTGKTSAIEGIARAWGEPLETVIAAIREPSDFSGLPVVRKDGVTFEPPAWAKRLCESKKGILFFDEISCFPGHVPVTMADGTSKPIEEVCVGDYVKTFDTKNGRSSSNLVSNVILRTRSDLIRLTMDDGSTIETTPDHPFWSEGEWKHAKDILGREVCILPGLRREIQKNNESACKESRDELGRVSGEMAGLQNGSAATFESEVGQVRKNLPGEVFSRRTIQESSSRRLRGEQEDGQKGSLGKPGCGKSLQDGVQCKEAVGIHEESMGEKRLSRKHFQEEPEGRDRGKNTSGDQWNQADRIGETSDRNPGEEQNSSPVRGGRNVSYSSQKRESELEESGLRNKVRIEKGSAAKHDMGSPSRTRGGRLQEGRMENATSLLERHGGRRETSVHVDRVHQVLRVESIESVPGTHTVYDITVENDHNFYADGILVHNCAPPATQAALLRVIFDRWVGDIQLPPDIRIVAAANPPEESAGGWDLPAPMANRFLHLDWTPYLAGWIEGMQSGNWLNGGAFSGKRIEGYEVHVPQCRVLVSAFVKAKPDLLLKVPSDAINAGRAWPSPRSWDMLARIWAAGRQGGANQDVMLEVARGCVGEGPGIEFVNWIRDLDLPDPEEVLANPKSFKLPKRGDQQYAVLSAIAHATISNLNPKRYIAAWEVMAIAAEEGAVDVACGAAKSLADAFVNDQSLPIPEKQVLPFKDLLKAAMVATS